MYLPNYQNHLNLIINLIKQNKIEGNDGAITKFKSYVDEIVDIGEFDSNNWIVTWRKAVYHFGEMFKSRNPQEFVSIINSKIDVIEKAKSESLKFILSEILFHALPSTESKTLLITYINEYPFNSEFRQTYSHYFTISNDHLGAIEQMELAIKIEPHNQGFPDVLFNKHCTYLSKLIEDGEYKVGLDYISKIYESKVYRGNAICHNEIVTYQTRIEDIIRFEKKISQLTASFSEKLQTDFDEQRKKVIEIVSVFSAIIAFILTTVSIGAKYDLQNSIFFIIALGLTLILFTTSISVMFNSNKIPIFKDLKFWITTIAIVLLLIFVLKIM